MGTYRSTYPIISEANRDTSIPQFAWFHPGNYMNSTRKGINPFQGSQHNPEGLTPFTSRLIPINESVNPVDPESTISEANRDTSAPNFSWFHPDNCKTSTRNGINPFQGSQHNPEGDTPFTNRLIPVNGSANPVEPSLKPELELETKKLTKKPKISRKAPNDGVPKEPKPKQKNSKEGSSNSPRVRRRSRSFGNNESSVNGDGTLSPFCSCTGVPRQCYRWGSGGWQSACCTINISEYPLPMSETRPGARTAGRKMSHGAFVKLLHRLSSEGYDLNSAIDLKDHWARHGTNKFVIIK